MQEEPLPPSPPQTMQWALLIITTVLTLALILIPVLVFYWTKSFFSFVPSTGILPLGYIWTCIVRHLFPKDPREYHLAEKKIEFAALSEHAHRATEKGKSLHGSKIAEKSLKPQREE